MLEVFQFINGYDDVQIVDREGALCIIDSDDNGCGAAVVLEGDAAVLQYCIEGHLGDAAPARVKKFLILHGRMP